MRRAAGCDAGAAGRAPDREVLRYINSRNFIGADADSVGAAVRGGHRQALRVAAHAAVIGENAIAVSVIAGTAVRRHVQVSHAGEFHVASVCVDAISLAVRAFDCQVAAQRQPHVAAGFCVDAIGVGRCIHRQALRVAAHAAEELVVCVAHGEETIADTVVRRHVQVPHAGEFHAAADVDCFDAISSTVRAFDCQVAAQRQLHVAAVCVDAIGVGICCIHRQALRVAAHAAAVYGVDT